MHVVPVLTLAIAPPPSARITGATACMASSGAYTLSSTTAWRSSRTTSSSGTWSPWPALFTRTSTRPKRSRAASTMPRTWSVPWPQAGLFLPGCEIVHGQRARLAREGEVEIRESGNLTEPRGRRECEKLLNHQDAAGAESAGCPPDHVATLRPIEVMNQVRDEDHVERIDPELVRPRVADPVHDPVPQVLAREDRGGFSHRPGEVQNLCAQPRMTPAKGDREEPMRAADVEHRAGTPGDGGAQRHLAGERPGQGAHSSLVQAPLRGRHLTVNVERPAGHDELFETTDPVPLREPEENAVVKRVRAAFEQPPPSVGREPVGSPRGAEVAGRSESVEELARRDLVRAATRRHLRRRQCRRCQGLEHAGPGRDHHRLCEHQRGVRLDQRPRSQPQ